MDGVGEGKVASATFLLLPHVIGMGARQVGRRQVGGEELPGGPGKRELGVGQARQREREQERGEG